MKVIITFLLLIIQTCIMAQINKLQSREDINYTEIRKNVFRLHSPGGKSYIKNVSDYNSLSSKPAYSLKYDSTIIDLTTIDTIIYYSKYYYWHEVPLNGSLFGHLIPGDVNNNGFIELYGSRKLFNHDAEPVTIYEFNGSTFQFAFQYDSVNICRNIYDLDGDGQSDLHLTSTAIFGDIANERFFRKKDAFSYANIYFLRFQPFDVLWQLNDLVLNNLDGDQYTDLLFIRAGEPDVHIYEYNPLLNNFESVYQFNVSEEAPWANAGFSMGDFDMDGNRDMVFGTGRGVVYVLENEGNNKYVKSWSGTVDTWHAYLHTSTNDIDRNGVPEFWVVGDAYYNGVPITRISIFEAFRDNSYRIVGRIDLIGVFSFYAGTVQAVDADNDGIDEVALCIDQNFLILKFNGSPNHHSYEVYYIKKNELAAKEENSVYFGAVMHDLDNDGREEILISMDEILENPHRGRRFTQIYKPKPLTNVEQRNLLSETSQLFQNYPNPFNPSTKISFDITETSNIMLRVFDILGKQVRILQQGSVNAGRHEIEWDGKDSFGRQLPGGVYFIDLSTGSYQKTIKAVIMR